MKLIDWIIQAVSALPQASHLHHGVCLTERIPRPVNTCMERALGVNEDVRLSFAYFECSAIG